MNAGKTDKNSEPLFLLGEDIFYVWSDLDFFAKISKKHTQVVYGPATILGIYLNEKNDKVYLLRSSSMILGSGKMGENRIFRESDEALEFAAFCNSFPDGIDRIGEKIENEFKKLRNKQTNCTEPSGPYYWRLLEEKEIIKEGYEVLNLDCESWNEIKKINDPRIGEPYSSQKYQPIRKKVFVRAVRDLL